MHAGNPDTQRLSSEDRVQGQPGLRLEINANLSSLSKTCLTVKKISRRGAEDINQWWNTGLGWHAQAPGLTPRVVGDELSNKWMIYQFTGRGLCSAGVSGISFRNQEDQQRLFLPMLP